MRSIADFVPRVPENGLLRAAITACGQKIGAGRQVFAHRHELPHDAWTICAGDKGASELRKHRNVLADIEDIILRREIWVTSGVQRVTTRRQRPVLELHRAIGTKPMFL